MADIAYSAAHPRAYSGPHSGAYSGQPAARDDGSVETAPLEPTLADVVEEVCRAVPSTVPRRAVIRTVRRCRRELDIVHGRAHPDRIRLLALARLSGEPA